MFNEVSYRMILMCIVMSNVVIWKVLQMCNEAYGVIQNKKSRIDVVFFTFVIMAFSFYFRVFQGEMDIPAVFSMKYETIEGTVCKYKIEPGEGVGREDKVDVKDNKTGKIMRFYYVDIPSELQTGDAVKMHYFKNNRMGAFGEINGKEIKYRLYHTELRYPVGGILAVLLLSSMPFYYFWIYKVEPVINYKLTYTAYAYHDIYIKAMIILYLFMFQTAMVLIIAVEGNYNTSWDWYWGLLLLADYAGAFCLSFLRQKQFIILEDKFYYCSFRKRLEGELGEIESAEKTDKGVLIRTKEAEMEVLCTSKRYRDALLGKLA